jgi:choline dehydrogenase
MELCREIGNSAALGPFTKREVMPGNLNGAELEAFVRDAAMSYWHQTCTAKMGRDAMSVVDGDLRVYGIDHLRIADGPIMPRVTTGNTMAPCVIIGERAADLLRAEHGLSSSLANGHRGGRWRGGPSPSPCFRSHSDQRL